LKNNFGILLCFVGTKIIFGLTIKLCLIFGKRFTVLKTVNRFSKLNSSSLHTRFISDCWNPVIVGCRNPGGTGIQQYLAIGTLMPTDQIPAGFGGSGQNGRDPAGFGQNGQDPAGSGGAQTESGQTSSPESDNGDQTFLNSGNSCIFTFRNFLCQPKVEKYFTTETI
jgi:hypothetical protein